MDSGTIIISAILLALAILPFVFTGKKYRRQKRQLVKTLNNLADHNQVRLSNYEACGSFAIGFDQTNRYLFFARIVQDEVSTRSILLAEVNRCKMKTSSRVLEEGEKVIDRVELALIPYSLAQPEILLEMYNSEFDTLTIRGELQTAIRWEQIINGVLNEARQREGRKASPKRAAFA